MPRLFEASEVLAAASWELQNHFQVGDPSSSSSSTGAATALSWRQPAPCLPPLLLVGTATGGAQVWVYQPQLMRWEQAAALGSPQVRAAVGGWAARGMQAQAAGQDGSVSLP